MIIPIPNRRDILLSILVIVAALYGTLEYLDYTVKNDFKTACATNTVESYKQFIINNPKSEYTYDAVKRRDNKAFSLARDTDTFESFQMYLESYPESEWKSNAIYHRDKWAFERAKEEKTLDAIVSFLVKYPKSSWTPNARYYLRHQFGYNHESEVDTESDDHRIVISKEIRFE